MKYLLLISVSRQACVFNSKYEFLREFGDERLDLPFEILVDSDTNFLYQTSYLNNTLNVWNALDGSFVKSSTIECPSYMRIDNNRLYVLSAIESEVFASKMKKTLIQIIQIAFLSSIKTHLK